jgi:hypothetical protein
MPDFNLLDIRSGRLLSQRADCTFKSTKKLDLDISGFLNKFKTSGNCGFPLANPQFDQSRDFVP